jgi:hypothetical protein
MQYPQVSDSGVRSGHKQSSLYSVSVFRQEARAAVGSVRMQYPQASDSGVRSGHKQSSLYSVSVFRQEARAAGGHLKGKKNPEEWKQYQVH